MAAAPSCCQPRPLSKAMHSVGQAPNPETAAQTRTRPDHDGAISLHHGSQIARSDSSAALPGPHLVHTPSESSGSQRSPAGISGRSFAQVAGAILRKQAQGQNPDKDEAAGSSPARPTT
jgi:hypothetical protein